MGKKQRWDGPAVTWKEPKKSCGHKDKARQARSCPHILRLCLFFSPVIFPLFRFTTVTMFLPQSSLSSLATSSPLPFSSPSPLLRWSFTGFCWVGSLPSARRPGILAWHWHTGRGPGVCSLCSGQLAEQLKVKHLELWNQRRCSDLTCTIFAKYYVTESWGEEGWNGKSLPDVRYFVLHFWKRVGFSRRVITAGQITLTWKKVRDKIFWLSCCCN